MPEAWIPERIIPYDPGMARVCGGVAPALLFCWFETLFEPHTQLVTEITKSPGEWRSEAGMLDSQFGKAFRRIGAFYHSESDYRLQRLGGREFWSEHRGRYLFYSLVVTQQQTRATLRRNGLEIDFALGRRKLQMPRVDNLTAKLGGKIDAQRLLKRLLH